MAGIRLPKVHFGFPGPQRDQLVASIIDGSKTATSSLLMEYLIPPCHSLPAPTDRSIVVDSADRPIALIEIISVRVIPLIDVDLGFAIAEGEGFKTVAEWRSAHCAFWQSDQMRMLLSRPDFVAIDDTLIVTERFHVVDLFP